MQRYSTVALIGSVSAAVTPGPVLPSSFPVFATLVPPATADKTSGAIN